MKNPTIFEIRTFTMRPPPCKALLLRREQQSMSLNIAGGKLEISAREFTHEDLTTVLAYPSLLNMFPMYPFPDPQSPFE